MKGITFLINETNKKRYVQIDIAELTKNPEKIEELIDVIVAESRKHEKTIPLEKVKKRLRKGGKI